MTAMVSFLSTLRAWPGEFLPRDDFSLVPPKLIVAINQYFSFVCWFNRSRFVQKDFLILKHQSTVRQMQNAAEYRVAGLRRERLNLCGRRVAGNKIPPEASGRCRFLGNATLPLRVISITPNESIGRRISTLLSAPVISMVSDLGCTSTILARKIP